MTKCCLQWKKQYVDEWSDKIQLEKRLKAEIKVLKAEIELLHEERSLAVEECEHLKVQLAKYVGQADKLFRRIMELSEAQNTCS